MTPFHYELSRMRQTPNPLEVEVVSRTRRLIAVAMAIVAFGGAFAVPAAASSGHPPATVANGPVYCC
jgi:hypothetical protein